MANIELNNLVNGITNQRQAQLPQVEGQIKKLQQISTALNNLKQLSINPELSGALAGVQFEEADRKIALGQHVLERAKQRLSRKNISIAVAGKARQGKSQFLQTLTGLTDKQIPTSRYEYCTASRSRIINTSSDESAIVYYMTERDFLDKKIYPAYSSDLTQLESLGLSPQPNSVRDFLIHQLPPLGEKTPSKIKLYEVLQDTQRDLNTRPEVVNSLNSQPRKIQMCDVKDYVTKNNPGKYYHVVDHVEIRTPFKVQVPEGLEVFDLPGLGEMANNIQETMLNAVKNDADIVLFLRKPNPSGDAWGEDYQTFDLFREIYKDEEIEPSDWIALILNEDTSVGCDNRGIVNTMRSSAPTGFKPIVCDCHSQESVNEMISTNMQALLANAKRIDDICVVKAQRDFEQAIQAGKNLVSQLEAAKSNLIVSKSDFKFDKKFEEFMGDLRAPFKSDVKDKIGDLKDKIQEKILDNFKEVYTTMENRYEQMDDKTDEFPDDFPVFTPKKLLVLFKGGRGTDEVVDESVRTQLWALVELMRIQMSQCCEKIRLIYLNKMFELIDENNTAIQKIIEKENNSSEISSDQQLESISNAIRRVNSISTSNIVTALERLRGLTLTYEQHILPLFYENPDILLFDPYSKGSDEQGTILRELKEEILSKKNDFEKQKTTLYRWLRERSRDILAALLSESENGPCARITQNIFLIIVANYRNFVNQFIWGKTIENEWKDYAENQQCVLWEDEFSEAMSKSKLNHDFLEKVNLLRQAVNA